MWARPCATLDAAGRRGSVAGGVGARRASAASVTGDGQNGWGGRRLVVVVVDGDAAFRSRVEEEGGISGPSSRPQQGLLGVATLYRRTDRLGDVALSERRAEQVTNDSLDVDPDLAGKVSEYELDGEVRCPTATGV